MKYIATMRLDPPHEIRGDFGVVKSDTAMVEFECPADALGGGELLNAYNELLGSFDPDEEGFADDDSVAEFTVRRAENQS